jgi:hypothetical protein
MMREAKFDALDEYRTSALFTDAERAALDYVTELTKDKKLTPTLLRASPAIIPSVRSARSSGSLPASICNNMTNIGLNIHSDVLCDLNKKRKAA